MSTRTGLERLETFEQIVKRLRAAETVRPSSFVPFPDREGEDRDEPRIIEWRFNQ